MVVCHVVGYELLIAPRSNVGYFAGGKIHFRESEGYPVLVGRVVLIAVEVVATVYKRS